MAGCGSAASVGPEQEETGHRGHPSLHVSRLSDVLLFSAAECKEMLSRLLLAFQCAAQACRTRQRSEAA